MSANVKAPPPTASSVKSSSSSSNNKLSKNEPCIWEWEQGPNLDAWMMRTLQEAAAKASSSTSSNSHNNSTSPQQHQLQQPVPAPVLVEPQVLQQWYQNIVTAIQSLRLVEAPQDVKSSPPDDDEEQEPARKRRKRQPKPRFLLDDPYHIWWITKYTEKPAKKDDGDNQEEEDEDDLPVGMGGRMAQLSAGAWLNALAGVQGGIVHKANPSKEAALKAAEAAAASSHTTGIILRETALQVHRTVQAKVQSDIWRTTPQRIQERLAPEITASEFASIRKRIYETVILGKGLHAGDEDDGADIPVAPQSAVHDVEKHKKCPNCGNMDQDTFALDRKNGDIICSNCGVVVSESLMHEGSAYRKFEGEADRNHHGDAANPLYSVAHNLSTSLSGVAPGSGIDGYRGGGGGKGLETTLRNVHAFTELNLSQSGNKDRRTRVGYKDRQKREAFVQMVHAGDALHLHEAVVQRAKELFAGFRDDRELVQQFKGVLAACLCEAFEQLARDGIKGHLVKNVGGNDMQEQSQSQSGGGDGDEEEEDTKPLSKRAARRSELHHASLAGRGGLELDFSNVQSKNAARAGGKDHDISDNNNTTADADHVGKPAATWNLEDCRSWLLGASRRIAQEWVSERQKAVNKQAAEKLPSGSLEELEGKLVEHSISLCESLELELQSRSGGNGGAHRNRVITPRVRDMSKLGIQWQHAHERGSGGKGGVGGSGTRAATPNGRTAGQILLLLTSKKLGFILNDNLAGEWIHRELRAVIGKQEERKRKLMSEEASRQRFLQMKRKPWLQARAIAET